MMKMMNPMLSSASIGLLLLLQGVASFSTTTRLSQATKTTSSQLASSFFPGSITPPPSAPVTTTPPPLDQQQQAQQQQPQPQQQQFQQPQQQQFQQPQQLQQPQQTEAQQPQLQQQQPMAAPATSYNAAATSYAPPQTIATEAASPVAAAPAAVPPPAAAAVPPPPAGGYNLAVSPEFAASLRSNEFADVTFLVEDERINAHRIILSNRCAAFRDLLDEYTKPFASVKLVIPIRNVEKQIFELLLEYLYTDVVTGTVEQLAPLYAAAAYYDLPACEAQVCDLARRSLTTDNAALILEQAFNYGYPAVPQNDALRQVVVEYCRQNFAVVSQTPAMQQYVQANALLAVVKGRTLM